MVLVCMMMCFSLFSIFTEMTYRHHMTLDGHYVALDIMDTAGEVR